MSRDFNEKTSLFTQLQNGRKGSLPRVANPHILNTLNIFLQTWGDGNSPHPWPQPWRSWNTACCIPLPPLESVRSEGAYVLPVPGDTGRVINVNPAVLCQEPSCPALWENPPNLRPHASRRPLFLEGAQYLLRKDATWQQGLDNVRGFTSTPRGPED